MTTGLHITRRWLIVLFVAALIALSTAYGPVALEMAGVAAGTPVYACGAPPGGC